MQLHAHEAGAGPSLLLLHSLFGSNENLSGVARAPIDHYRTIALGLVSAALIGHPFGVKTAMELALFCPERVESLVVRDIAPVSYDRHHDEKLDALLGLDLAAMGLRREADEALTPPTPNAGVRQLLLKNLRPGETGFEWRLPSDNRGGIPAHRGHPGVAGPLRRTRPGPPWGRTDDPRALPGRTHRGLPGVLTDANAMPRSAEPISRDLHSRVACPSQAVAARASSAPPWNVSRSSSASTRMVSPGPKRPARISRASGFSSSCWIARLSGRAP